MTRFLTQLLLGGSCLALATVGVLAQQSVGPEITLDVNQRFSTNSNQTLTPGGAPRTTRSSTRLTFGFINETPASNLTMRLGSTLNIFKDGTTSGFEADPLDPDLTLRYSNETASSRLTANLRYREDEVRFLRPLDDFLNEDGEIELPTDADDLNGLGTRINETYNASLDLFTDAPVTLSLNAGYDLLRYSGTTSASLFRTETIRLGARVSARLSETTTASLSFSRREYEADDTNSTDRVTDSYSLGLRSDVSPVLSLNASIGRTEVETRTTTGVTRTTGTNGRLGATLDRPNGRITLNYTVNTNQNGTRERLSLGRRFTLSDIVTLDTMIGATRTGNGDWQGTGRVSYRQDLPSGALRVNYTRTVQDSDDNNDGNVASLLSANYSHTINNWSSMNFSASLSDRNGVEQSQARASYRRDMAQEWKLETGYQFNSREQAGTARADSHEIFLSLNRRFNLRP